jgi:Cu(I)/Ag(I) efflux system membrane fusion protein
MRRSVRPLLIVSAILAAGLVGLAVGRSNGPLPGWLSAILPAAAKKSPSEPAAIGPIVYFRDPDGLPNYSPTPKKASSGKAYSAVRSSEDLSFEEKAPEAKSSEAMAAKGGDPHRIKYYRNPMGLPDKSATPKKDNMGMDYLPVY